MSKNPPETGMEVSSQHFLTAFWLTVVEIFKDHTTFTNQSQFTHDCHGHTVWKKRQLHVFCGSGGALTSLKNTSDIIRVTLEEMQT